MRNATRAENFVLEFFTLAAPTLLRAAATSSLYMRPRALTEGPRPNDEPTPLQGAWRIPPKVFPPKNGEAIELSCIKKFKPTCISKPKAPTRRIAQSPTAEVLV